MRTMVKYGIPFLLCLSLIFQLSCQTINNLIDNWYTEDLIPESFTLPFEPNIISHEKSSYFGRFPAQESIAIEISQLGVQLHAARFKSIKLAIAAFLETKDVGSQPMSLKKNYWAYIDKNEQAASMWRDRSVYLIKSSTSKDKEFYTKFFEKITHELPARNKRPPQFRIFLHPKTDITGLRYFWKESTSDNKSIKQNSILTHYFYAPWKLSTGSATLGIRPFPTLLSAKHFFYRLVAPGHLRFLTQWNTQTSGNKEFSIDSKQKVKVSVEKDVSYPVVIGNRGIHHDYFIIYNNNVILLTGEVPEKVAREIISNVFSYLD